MNVLKVLVFCVLAGIGGLTEGYGQDRGLSTTVTGGRGLLLMQSARTFGQGYLTLGIKGFSMDKESLVRYAPGEYLRAQDKPLIVALPVSLGLTDEIDLTASLFAFRDARSLLDNRDIAAGYGSPEQGIGASWLGVKIRLPLPSQSHLQIAGQFGASMDTSDRELDGLNYFWTRRGTSIESSIYETWEITPSLSLNLEQGYAISGSRLYDDQLVGAAGLQLHLRDRVALNLEVNNRTFLGVSPQSAFHSAEESRDDVRGAAPGPFAFMRDTRADFLRDYLVFAPSLAFRVNRFLSLDAGAVFNLADQASPKDKYQLVAGLTFSTDLRAMLDSDGDGISNNRDAEIRTPKGYPVDKRGVALDSDGDGIPDGRDLQPDTPHGAKRDARGVGYDSDGDGVYDGLDAELQTPRGAPVDRFGVALDDDRDGIPNDRDFEPNSPRGAIVNHVGRSLDSDGDGVPEGIDVEPQTPRGAMVNAAGASLDGDGDGVPDGIDEEANTPKSVLVDKKGRALIPRDMNLVNEGAIRLNTLHFEGTSLTPGPESSVVLDEIGRLLIKFPALMIQIEGHTDESGNPEKNYRVSRERARAALEYLLKRFPGLRRDRFRVVGFGADKPSVSNATPEGRKANRRVDFVVINQGELMKASDGN